MTTTTMNRDKTGRECRKLLERYRKTIEPNPRLDRTLVSFQANRKRRFLSWFKYREAFSADLANYILSEFRPQCGEVLDPFSGMGTTLFCSREAGLNSIGIELLPVGAFITDARLSAEQVRPKVFQRYVEEVEGMKSAGHYDPRFVLEHIPITAGAFSPANERAIAGFRAYCAKRIRNARVRKLFELAGLAVLEDASFTRKDGQYLRWDSRAGKPRVQAKFDKGPVLNFDRAVRQKLVQMANDIAAAGDSNGLLFKSKYSRSAVSGAVDLRIGSCLEILPTIPDESIGLVLTSPPYCNRYDYTRTYALELIYLGLNQDDVKALRQAMLSCTVENRVKDAQLRGLYAGLGQEDACRRVESVFHRQAALLEVVDHLVHEGRCGRLNNANIPRMVRNYFFEMCFVVHELVRILVPGGRIVMVNDNVRYNGAEVPVDLILSDFAASFGAQVEHIWVLARGKGNSSQQMGRHGRAELRKCVYVWRKPSRYR